jgi:hypothetical protein
MTMSKRRTDGSYTSHQGRFLVTPIPGRSWSSSSRWEVWDHLTGAFLRARTLADAAEACRELHQDATMALRRSRARRRRRRMRFGANPKETQ